jgi:hypothetical protein
MSVAAASEAIERTVRNIMPRYMLTRNAGENDFKRSL